jgi:hypothetical protein
MKTMGRTTVSHLALAAALLWISAAAVSAQSPARVTGDEFATLDWLEGRWVGSGPGQGAFYEEYRRVGEGVIEQTTWTDSTFSTRQSSSRIELVEGYVIVSSEDRRSVVTDFDDESVRFEWEGGGRLGYTWTRVSDDEWYAVLDRKGDAPVVYSMRRVSERP